MNAMNHIKKPFIYILLLPLILIACGKNSKNDVSLTNQWGETQSLSVATDWAGVDFVEPPATIALEDGQDVELTTYRYATGIVEALYAGEGYELRIRRSDTYQGSELAEDPSSYLKTWDAEGPGIPVSCYGDGNTVNLAFFDAGGDHFTVTYNPGSEGNGLSETDLLALITKII